MHRLFEAMQEKAEKKQLSAEQIDLFTRAMMARIFYTMPHITGLLQRAMLDGDTDLTRTAIQNLSEEFGSDGKTHPQLAEEAFNALRQAFELKRLTLKDAYDDLPLSESYTQASVWRAGYQDFPAIASWLQESASGGNSDNQKGMIADMFPLFEAYRERIGKAEFTAKVLPYFEEHVSIQKDGERYQAKFSQKGIEHQHGIRAEADAVRAYASTSKSRRGDLETKATAFLDAQDQLFNAILAGVERGGRIR